MTILVGKQALWYLRSSRNEYCMQLRVQLNPTRLHPLAETLERIRLTVGSNESQWSELIGVSWKQYQDFKSGQSSFSLKNLDALATEYGIKTEDIYQGNIEFSKLSILTENDRDLPERYTTAAFGRRRSSISSLNFLEETVGWRLRMDVMKRFGIPESQFVNPFAPISILFMVDLCDYLVRRGFTQGDLFQMGLYSYETSQKTILGDCLSEAKDTEDLLERFIASIKLFEDNCSYKLNMASNHSGSLDVYINKYVAEALGQKTFGSSHLCAFKMGHFASTPLLINQPQLKIHETACIHRGDSHCRFEFVTQGRTQ